MNIYYFESLWKKEFIGRGNNMSKGIKRRKQNMFSKKKLILYVCIGVVLEEGGVFREDDIRKREKVQEEVEGLEIEDGCRKEKQLFINSYEGKGE